MHTDRHLQKIEKFGRFELVLDNTRAAVLAEDCAVFTNGREEFRISAFKNGDDSAIVRFMPMETGMWSYHISLCGREWSGRFECVENTGNNHGPVAVEGDHFRYADGARYIPFGTTCYAWLHQTEALQAKTLETLAASPFNKLRMCVFPKSMPYNENDPDCYPFLKKADGTWDVSRPDPRFWEKLDRHMEALMDLGIEADLIVFHPYDRWGFSTLSREESLTYLNYCIARLSAYRNLWWCLANEYEMLYAKNTDDWDACGELLLEKDRYGHLISIHNIISPYPKRPWMTHCSIQSSEIDRIVLWKQKYECPVIIDECGYEGDLPYDWGNLTAFEMVHRFWWTVCRGGFCTHGETYYREDAVLWWAKGGTLYGESAKRIGFMKELLYGLPGIWHTPEIKFGNPNGIDPENESSEAELRFYETIRDALPEDRTAVTFNLSSLCIEGDGWQLKYFGRRQPVYTELDLAVDKKFRVEVIDLWEMTKKTAAEGVCGHIKIGLPAKEGIAVLITEL